MRPVPLLCQRVQLLQFLNPLCRGFNTPGDREDRERKGIAKSRVRQVKHQYIVFGFFRMNLHNRLCGTSDLHNIRYQRLKIKDEYKRQRIHVLPPLSFARVYCGDRMRESERDLRSCYVGLKNEKGRENLKPAMAVQP